MAESIFNSGKIFVGINYWASNNAINMWHDWDAEKIGRDFKRLKETGISVLRIFPLWSDFQPLTALYMNNGERYEYRFGEDRLPDSEAGHAGVSAIACEHFEELCSLAQKYDLKLIIALITGHMSFRIYSPEAFAGRNFLSDPTTIKWEIRYVTYFVNRFKCQSSIVGWDLGNECSCIARDPAFNPDHAYVWVSAITNAVKICDSTRPVITGLDESPISQGSFNLLDIGEQIDVQTVHPYNIFSTNIDALTSMRSVLDSSFRCRLYTDIGGKPTFVQEVGSIGYMNCSEKSEADFYRGLFFSAWADDCLGIMWWCAFDQGQLDYAPYCWNNIGSNYGFFRADGSKKKIAEENLHLKSIMDSLPFDTLPPKLKDAVCIVQRADNIDLIPVLRSVYCLAKQANLDIDFTYALEPIPDAKVYFMPSIQGNQPITKYRFEELLEKVKDGATLYMSYYNSLFRDFPEISGLKVSGRCLADSHISMEMDLDCILLDRINELYKYNIESCYADVIAISDTQPIFVKKAYGRGYIYTLLYPLEKMLSEKAGAFSDDLLPRYDKIYREVMKSVHSERCIDSDSRFIRTSEHIIDESNRYIVAINFSDEKQKCNLLIDDNWRISEQYYNTFERKTLELESNDAAIFKISKQ
ncbi:MAG: hypothetical protein K5768_03335 [Firmicutes bacterium]|nr:hypothetical protein [Bacillota bacterium]